MKKVLAVLTILIVSYTYQVSAEELPEITGREKVNLYLFRGDGCGYCKEAVDYLNDLEGKYDNYYNVVVYEINNNSNNYDLYKSLMDHFGLTRLAVPFVVVGDSFNSTGFTGTTVINAALNAYENVNYIDLVSTYQTNYNATAETLEEACYNEGITYHKYSNYINDREIEVQTNDTDIAEEKSDLKTDSNSEANEEKKETNSTFIIVGTISFLVIGIGVIVHNYLKNKKMTEI